MVIREGYYPNGFKYAICLEKKAIVLKEEKSKKDKRFHCLKGCQRYIDNKTYNMVRID